MPSRLRPVILAAVASLLSGCAPYLDRIDAVAFDHGNAVRANMVQHIIDPWPAHAQNTNLTTNGHRSVTAVRAYRCRPAGRDIAGAPSSSGTGNGQGSGSFGASVTINTGSAGGSSQGTGGTAPECL